MCLYGCLDWPLTINFKRAHSNILQRSIPHPSREQLLECSFIMFTRLSVTSARCKHIPQEWDSASEIFLSTSSLPQAGVPKVYISNIWSSPRLICDAVYFLPWRGGRTARRAPSLSVSACRRTPLHKVGSGRPWNLLILAMPLIACDCIILGLVSEMFPERCAGYKNRGASPNSNLVTKTRLPLHLVV